MQPTVVEIDGVGKVELDSGFRNLSPQEQQATIEEIARSAQKKPSGQTAPVPAAAKPRTKGPPTAAAMEAALEEMYPGQIRVNSAFRDPAHNARVGGVTNSNHLTDHSLDIKPIPGVPIEQVAEGLRARGFDVNERLFHNGHYHLSAASYADPNAPAHQPDDSNAPIEGDPAPLAVDVTNDRAPWETEEDYAARSATGAPPPPKPAGWGELAHQGATGLAEGALDTAGIAISALDKATLGSDALSSLGLPILRRLGEDKLKQLGIFADDPENRAGSYARSIGRGVGATASAGPGAVSQLGPKVALPLVTGGAGSGAAGELSEDIAPGNAPLRFGMELAGGALGAGIPAAGRVVAQNVGQRRFVNSQVENNPYAAFDAEIAEDLTGLVKRTANAKTDPAGRASVTIKAVNNLEGRYTAGFREKINALDIPQAQKQRLRDALVGRFAMPLDELSSIRGSVAGDAVADAIIKIQRLRQLTPEVKRGGPLSLVKGAVEATATVGAGMTGGPVMAPAGYGLARYLLRRGSSSEAARVHSAEKVMNREKAYQKVAAKVGPSGQRESQDALNRLYESTVSGREAAKAAQAADRARQAAERMSTKSDNARIVINSHRDNVKPSGGYRGYVYESTGLMPKEQDVGLLTLLQRGHIDEKTFNRVLKDPNSLKGGAGSAIVDRLRALADEGKLARDPDWVPTPKAAEGASGAPWVDAEGAPIRSWPAYQGGMLKNIIRELSEEAAAPKAKASPKKKK